MKRFGITDPAMEDYIYNSLPERPQVLLDMEAHAARENLGIIGPMQGQFLYTLALATGAKEILEVGTAIGYSATWLGLAAQRSQGRVVTLEKDDGRASWAEAYFRQAGLDAVCAVRRGDALTTMKGMQSSFDLIFLDILTQFNQPETALEMLEMSILLLKTGGVLLSDNALRSGRVLNPGREDYSTQGIAAFNSAILSHPRLASSIIPIRDGLSLSVKLN